MSTVSIEGSIYLLSSMNGLPIKTERPWQTPVRYVFAHIALPRDLPGCGIDHWPEHIDCSLHGKWPVIIYICRGL